MARSSTVSASHSGREGGQMAPPQTESSTSHACKECRRRKARCSRELPVCFQCLQNKRHCLYERHVRTPLTRKHLTEVEELLQIATNIIRERLPDVDLSAELARTRNGDATNTQDIAVEDKYRHIQTTTGSKRPRTTPSSPSADQTGCRSHHSDDTESDILALCLESIGDQDEDRSADFYFDIPPTTSTDNSSINGSSYEWDERQSGAQSCNDGMAALSLEDEKPGYLGLASGAALLHLIQSYSSDAISSTTNLKTSSLPMEQPTQTPLAVDLHREIPKDKIEGYIADYFNTYHISYPLVHQGLFMAQYHEIVPRPKTGWMVFMYVVAAIGAFRASTTPNDDDLVLFHCARTHLSIEMLEVGNLTLVQSLSLISNYLQKRDRPNSSYNYLGLAVRMAFGLGLHKDFPTCTMNNLLHMEMRRRTWWCLYIFDTGSTITFSRPIAVSSAGIDAKLPLNTFDCDLTASTMVPPEKVAAPTVYTNVRVQSQFHLLTNNLYNRIISKPFPSAKQVLAWDDYYIGKWFDLVPEFYKENAAVPERHALTHAIMTWRYKHLRMILYRPFLIQTVLKSPRKDHDSSPRGSPDISWSSSSIFTGMACDRCLKESHDSIVHITRFWKHHPRTRMACWYALYFLFPATLIPVICIRNDPQLPLSKGWREDIKIATETIKDMVDLSPLAERCFRNLERLCAEWLTPAPRTHESEATGWMPDPTNDSPIAQMLSMHGMMWPEISGIENQEQSMTNSDLNFLSNPTANPLHTWGQDYR